jgi:hypothetical protein
MFYQLISWHILIIDTYSITEHVKLLKRFCSYFFQLTNPKAVKTSSKSSKTRKSLQGGCQSFQHPVRILKHKKPFSPCPSSQLCVREFLSLNKISQDITKLKFTPTTSLIRIITLHSSTSI